MQFQRVLGFLIVSVPAIAGSAGPRPEAVRAWDEYIRSVDLRFEQEVDGSRPFLWMDQGPARAALARRGEILVASKFGSNSSKPVPYGLIHDGIGAIFIPGVTLADVLAVVHDYDRYREFYEPGVVNAALLCRTDSGSGREEESFRIRYVRKVLFVNEVLESEYQARNVQLDAQRWYTIAQSTRLEDVRQQSGRGVTNTLTESRYVWRIYSISKYEERDGGVYFEQETAVLSRSIPTSLRWLIEPAIRLLSKDVVVTSLRQTREAVLASAHDLTP